MYYSYKDGEQVNGISELTFAHIQFELALGHVFAKGELTQENVDAAYDDLRKVMYKEISDPMYIESDPLITSDTNVSRVDWRNARNQVKADYPTPTI